MYNTSFIKKILLALIVVFLYSCDKDFNAIGDGLVGDDHFGLELEEYNVLAFNQEVTPIQSNNMAVNALGIFDNPLFGTTTANFVTQVGLESYAPTIGESPVIESVQLTIPYFVKNKVTDDKGDSTYELDSIYGGQGSNYKLKLSVYASGYQMRNSYFSGGTQLPQFYYTDQNTDFFNNKLGNRLNDEKVSETDQSFKDDQFFFDSKEIVTKTVDADNKETITRTAPQMVLNLNKQFFQDKILNASVSKLSSEDVFQDYFRGLYFMVEKSGSSPSNMALINFSGGKITIKYKAKTASTTDGDATEDKQIIVGLKSGVPSGVASTASFLQDVRNPDYENVIKNGSENEGDERLYLKGGQGSLAVIRLNDFASQLETIRKTNWKVNEANLVFYVDTDKMGTTKEPKRVYLYDLTNNTVLLDYSSDDTAAYGGGLITVDSKKGKYFKIRITSHIRNLIKDSTAKNVDLGLVVALSGGVINSNALKEKNTIISQAPRTSVMSPLGTVLYGGKTSAGDKRLKLEVYYTKPN
ncbi:DUF4270 domain-containing protein [Flavobacterium notoginsengisoli]|uniref:DUF4270 domain-containing protein n=1 Tax=Flavobacterium notoginsengisoli TaxID=1478199 RepID=UPI0036417BCA